MNKKLITVVLWVIASIGGCAALGTQADETYDVIEHLAKPSLDALVNATSPLATGQPPF